MAKRSNEFLETKSIEIFVRSSVVSKFGDSTCTGWVDAMSEVILVVPSVALDRLVDLMV